MKNETLEKTRFELVYFPRCNKQHFLTDNDREIREDLAEGDTLPERCIVEKVITLTDSEWSEFTTSLLHDRPDWFEGIGGSFSDSPRLQDISWPKIMNDPGLLNEFHRTSSVRVVEVRCPLYAWSIFVNTEGYDYARYVGRSSEYDHNSTQWAL
tara:strand:- start:16499 stop:16960 length:462 start_codon:yes stop_codon:yes gene_type:complete